MLWLRVYRRSKFADKLANQKQRLLAVKKLRKQLFEFCKLTVLCEL